MQKSLEKRQINVMALLSLVFAGVPTIAEVSANQIETILFLFIVRLGGAWSRSDRNQKIDKDLERKTYQEVFALVI
jgi:hypothetical protein